MKCQWLFLSVDLNFRKSLLVLGTGLEPAILSETASKTVVSANSTTRAMGRIFRPELASGAGSGARLNRERIGLWKPPGSGCDPQPVAHLCEGFDPVGVIFPIQIGGWLRGFKVTALRSDALGFSITCDSTRVLPGAGETWPVFRN